MLKGDLKHGGTRCTTYLARSFSVVSTRTLHSMAQSRKFPRVALLNPRTGGGGPGTFKSTPLQTYMPMVITQLLRKPYVSLPLGSECHDDIRVLRGCKMGADAP
jgi:hypothetical protein